MTRSRVVLVLGGLAFAFFVVTEAQWESRLEHAGGAYIFHAPRAPLWSPPPKASYSEFREAFSGSQGFPPEQSSTVVRVLKWDWMLVEALLWLWAATGLASIVYLGDERDWVLRAAVFSCLGLTAGALASVGLWVVLGGWGPVMPEFFGVVGLVVGVACFVVTRQRTAQQAAAPVEPEAARANDPEA